MAASLFSSSWYRVSDLKPRLRSHAQIHRQRFRDQTWYVLQDHASGRFHRFSPEAHFIVGLMNGQHTVNEIWELASERLGDDLPTQDEVIRLLAQLHHSDVLQTDVPPDVIEVVERTHTLQRRALMLKIRNPMALRFPLFDPDRFLTATQALVRPLFTPAFFILSAALILYAAVMASLHWTALTENLADRVFAAENIILMILTYPFIKTLHELGHGYAVKRWGGEVHEMGIMLLVLMPVPYVDATSSSAFREKWRRAIVGGAGIMVEMILAAISVIVWLNVEPGLVRAAAFNVMLLAGVSTLLFNGNPLLRYDGYYVLVDLLEIPNLGSRANRFLVYLLQRYLFGMEDATSPATARGEQVWFVLYGTAAFFYRLFIMVVICLFIATKFLFIGLLLAIWAAVMMFVVPIAKGLRFLVADSRLRRHRRRAVLTTCGVIGTVAAALTLVPVPYATIAEGVVWLPDNALVHARTDGVITKILARPNDPVEAGQPLIQLQDPYLSARVRFLQAELAEFKLRLGAMEVVDLVQADIIRERIKLTLATLALNRQRARDLTLRSRTKGRFVLPGSNDLPGRFVRKGDLLAFVINSDSPTIRIIVPQQTIDLVHQRTRFVSIRFVDNIHAVFPGTILREVPAATNKLPSKALATIGGGDLAMDPTNPGSAKTLDRFFQIDIGTRLPLHLSTTGGRAFVRLDHGREPIAFRLYRSLRQLFLSRFNV